MAEIKIKKTDGTEITFQEVKDVLDYEDRKQPEELKRIFLQQPVKPTKTIKRIKEYDKTHKNWTTEEEEIIKKHHLLTKGKIDINELMRRLPTRTIQAIRRRMYDMKLTMTRRLANQWTKEEEEMIRKGYEGERIDWDFLRKELPNRTLQAILQRAYKLGLSRRKRKHYKPTTRRTKSTHIAKRICEAILLVAKNNPNKKITITEIMRELGVVSSGSSIQKFREIILQKRNYLTSEGISVRNKKRRKRYMTTVIYKTGILLAKPKLLKTQKTKRKYTFEQWTKEEVNILKEAYKKDFDMEDLLKALPKRTEKNVSYKANYLGLKRKTTKKKQLEEYVLFVKEKKGQYEKQGMFPDVAKKLAINDWHKYKEKGQTSITEAKSIVKIPVTKKKIDIPETFPEFTYIEKDFLPILETATRHIIANKGTKLGFLNCRDSLNIIDGRQWYNFVAEFMKKR